MQIKQLMEFLDLGELIENPGEIKGGLLHKMYRVTTSNGIYAVKVLNSEIMKRPMALTNTINSEIIAEIFSNDIPAVSSLKIQDRQIHELNGTYYMVFPWVKGKSVFPPDINEWHCEAIGDILGKIHQKNMSFAELELEREDLVMYEWDHYLQMAKLKSQEDRNYKSDKLKVWLPLYEKSISDIKNWSREACNSREVLSRNIIVSHRDLDPKNVLWDGINPYIIDWEAAGYVNPYQELLEVINYWADDGQGSLKRRHFDRIMNAYEKYIDVTDAPWNAVFAGGYAGMLGWLEYNIRRALGIEASDAEEIRLGEEQVIGTIKALYDYRAKVVLLRVWLGNDIIVVK